MFTDILWRFLILETFVLGALYDNTCIFDHPQKQFCTSDFVMEVKFHKVIHLPVRYTFRAEIVKVLKGNVNLLHITADQYVNVVTNKNLHFFVGEEFIIFGREENGSIYTDTCDRNMPWKYTKTIFRHVLELFYKYKCDCIDEVWGNRRCQNISYITKKRNKDCMWVKDAYVRYCQNGLLDYDSLFNLS